MLKAIKIANFKSFGQPEEIKLGAGFNCVTGPNGTGKSNLFDAICFVLGEPLSRLRVRSTKELLPSAQNHQSLPNVELQLSALDGTPVVLTARLDPKDLTRKHYRDGKHCGHRELRCGAWQPSHCCQADSLQQDVLT
jgi:chromosome segregation ATPase